MKKLSKIMSMIVGLFLILSYCLPGQALMAEESNTLTLKIIKAEVDGGKLQPGDSFSINLVVRVTDGNIDSQNYRVPSFTEASVSGAELINGKAGLTCSTNDNQITQNGDYKIKVSNLCYESGSNSVNVSVQAQADSQPKKGNESLTFTSNSYDVKLNAYSSSELDDMISIDKKENILVRSDLTQNVEVNVTNKGKTDLRQVEAKLSLGSSVEGIKIKRDTSQITNLKSKEVKKATFSIEVDKDTKAGVYPATVTVLGTPYPVNIQVDSSVVPSALEVSVGSSGIYTPGVGKDTTINVRNVGERDAKNVRVELVKTDDVAIMSESNVRRLDIVSAKSTQQVKFKVRIASNSKSEAVALPIKISYLNSNGEQTDEEQYVYLNTNSTSAASEINISNVISPVGVFGVDESFNVKFNVSAKKAAEGIQVSVEGDEGIVPKSQNLFFINKLKDGETKQYTVVMAATRAAVTSSHPLKITVTYGSGDSATTINQYGSVNITNPKKDKEDNKDEKVKGKPKVIIGQYAVEPIIVQAGKNFKLTLGFLNTSKIHSVHNLKANILPVEQESKEANAGTDNVFTPVKGSNTIYISDLSMEQQYTTTLEMYTIPSAAAKTYQITVNMVYEDEEGNEIEGTETLGIPVEQKTKVEVGDINVAQGEVGTPIPLSVTFYNRGRTNINNMMVYIEGDGFEVQENRTFIGTFEIGASEVYEPTIVPNQTGSLSGTLIVEYEDPSGNAQKEEHPFDFQVDEAAQEEMPPEDMPGMDEKGKKNNHLFLYIGIGVGVVIVIIIIIVILKKRKAKKEERLLNEED